MTFVWLAVVVLGVVGLAVVARVVLRGRREVVAVPVQRPVRAAAPEDVEGLVKAGRKVDAIRAWRQRHGGGLKEAKEAVETLSRGQAPRPAAKHDEPSRQVTEQDIRHQLRHGNVIDAIKLYREKTGVGLREAKEAVESIRHRMSAS